jgi:hypothetical protein
METADKEHPSAKMIPLQKRISLPKGITLIEIRQDLRSKSNTKTKTYFVD